MKRLMWILWPAFLTACALELLVFALVDPADLHWFGRPLALSREAVYTLAFFTFWLVAAGSATMTTLLSLSSRELNQGIVPDSQR